MMQLHTHIIIVIVIVIVFTIIVNNNSVSSITAPRIKANKLSTSSSPKRPTVINYQRRKAVRPLLAPHRLTLVHRPTRPPAPHTQPQHLRHRISPRLGLRARMGQIVVQRQLRKQRTSSAPSQQHSNSNPPTELPQVLLTRGAQVVTAAVH